ncbi:MAG: polyphosphate:AMP phosphotransferase [Planctomycetes bacterium]|jgi:polyphosphate:AMP phosphotransferase|nr:polyphosphate:AMP phosphotransferase [Planctomycetota bacterium]
MFESAELGQKVTKTDFRRHEPVLREKLLEAEWKLAQSEASAIVLFSGVDAAGKGELATLLSTWMDPRRIVTRAYGPPSEEERERPEYWRYWRDLPARGHLGVFLSAWYERPLLDRVQGRISASRFDEELERIIAFERTLANDGTLIVKFWMHLSAKAQRRRLAALAEDPLTAWRVTKRDFRRLKLREELLAAAERMIMRTSTGRCPWHIVEGLDERYRSLRVGGILLDALDRGVTEGPARRAKAEADQPGPPAPAVRAAATPSLLSTLDLGAKLPKRNYELRRPKYEARLNVLRRRAREKKTSTILVFEGWDAAGKGGAIRALTAPLDARDYEVISVAAPTDEERAHHYLWRFWRRLSRAGRITIFDRSWYGRVLVERVEGLATENEWRRAYVEVNEFERQLVEHGVILVKFWLHISKEEQARRFRERQRTPHKRWKLTGEDWRNREKWDRYEEAVNDMLERTSTRAAPWILVPAEDKLHARLEVLRQVCRRMDAALP